MTDRWVVKMVKVLLPLRIRMTLHMRKATMTVLPTSCENCAFVTATSREKEIITTAPSSTCRENRGKYASDQSLLLCYCHFVVSCFTFYRNNFQESHSLLSSRRAY